LEETWEETWEETCEETWEETWGSYNVPPHRVVELFQRYSQGAAAAWKDSGRLLPGRCLECGVRRLLDELNGRIEGVGLCFRETRK
jgi:hypothetical protein